MIVAILLHLSRILHDNPVSSRICELIDDSEQGGARKRARIAVPSRAALRDASNKAELAVPPKLPAADPPPAARGRLQP
jgi:hypothetical protein